MKIQTRNSSIELLRILAALGVVLLHYNNTRMGGALAFVENGSFNKGYLFFAESVFVCAVDVFILISGYFLSMTEKRHFIRVIELLLQLIIFRLIFYFAGIAASDIVFSPKGLLEALLPVDYYVILYLTLFIISPFLNVLIKKLRRKDFKRMLVILFILFSVWTIFVDVAENFYGGPLQGLSTISLWGTQYGYTIVNFTMLYLIGAYIQMYSVKLSKIKSGLGFWILAILVTILSIAERFIGLPDIASWGYNNPLVIGMATCLFLFFLNFRFENKIINELAKAVFTCYLFHRFFLKYLFIERFVNGNIFLLILHQSVCAIALFLGAYLAYKIYHFCTDWFIRLLTPACDKVNISVDKDNGIDSIMKGKQK